MKIGSIQNGIVIDHITAGRSMRLYDLLGLESADCQVALIKNAVSGKMGRKDIIKIGAIVPLDLDIIAYVDPKATINIIQDDENVVNQNKKAWLDKFKDIFTSTK